MWKRNLTHTHTHPAWICGYVLTHAGSVSQRRGCCVAGWPGVKALQSYWRQVWRRRWLTKPKHMDECCLGHLTVRPSPVCVYLCMLAYTHLCICVGRVCCVNSGRGQSGLGGQSAYRPKWGRMRGARAGRGTPDWSWTWMGGGWGVECLIQTLTGTASHSRRRYSIHWTPSIP